MQRDVTHIICMSVKVEHVDRERSYKISKKEVISSDLCNTTKKILGKQRTSVTVANIRVYKMSFI